MLRSLISGCCFFFFFSFFSFLLLMSIPSLMWRSAGRRRSRSLFTAFAARPSTSRPTTATHSYSGLFRMASTLPRLPVFEAITKHDPESTAVVHSLSGRRFKYGELLGDVCRTWNRLHEAAGKGDINGERVAFLVENSYDYVGKPHETQRNEAIQTLCASQVLTLCA